MDRMKERVFFRDPLLVGLFNQPDWCHHHGLKMRLKMFDENVSLVLIDGSAATVKIFRVTDPTSTWDWIVEWEIKHGKGEKVNGSVCMDTEELEAAFMLSQLTGKWGDELIKRFGAHTAQQGSFIRWKKYLNIPGPGTGHDGDPNVSIFLDKEITEAVRSLVASACVAAV